MKEEKMTTAAKAKNAERLLYRERKGDPLANSVRLMRDGRIGIDCDVHIIIKTLQEWHDLAVEAEQKRQSVYRQCSKCAGKGVVHK